MIFIARYGRYPTGSPATATFSGQTAPLADLSARHCYVLPQNCAAGGPNGADLLNTVSLAFIVSVNR